jgi:hypothetical protein
MVVMVPTLAALLLAASPAAAPSREASAPIRLDGSPAAVARPLAGAADVIALCGRLTPVERLRPAGDAVDRGEREARHDAERDEAITARYEITVPASRLSFAPYDGPEQRLGLAEPASLVLGDGAARLWPTEERGLPARVDAAGARRILAAQKGRTLSLRLTFDLPDDAVCGADLRGKRVTLAMEPVGWSYLDGETVLARGGAGADRPVLTAAQGARPRVEVGEATAGPAAAKRAVLTRSAELEGCYAEALKRDPELDGVVVVELGPPKVSVAADSTGSAELAACVGRALESLAAANAGRVAIPIRFELLPPGADGAPASQGAGPGGPR